MSLGLPSGAPGIHPLDDRRDLLVAERHVVLELLHADGFVDVPRRHLARDHALPDRFRPRARFVVGHERHRGHGAFAVAVLALLLQNRGDVFSERDWGVVERRRRNGQREENPSRTNPVFLMTHSSVFGCQCIRLKTGCQTGGNGLSRQSRNVPLLAK